MMKQVQIIYPKATNSAAIHKSFIMEAKCMASKGFYVGSKAAPGMTHYLYRGFTKDISDVYQNPLAWINNFQDFSKTLNMTEFLDIIAPWSFKSKVIPCLNEQNLKEVLTELNCDRLFIKNNTDSLYSIREGASVYPTTSAEILCKEFNQYNLPGPFIAREYIDDKEIFFNEQRIWVLNGHVYSIMDMLPDFVKEAAKVAFEFTGSNYFTLDVAGNYIVEINPGESSDRGGDNPLEWFCDIFANEFL